MVQEFNPESPRKAMPASARLRAIGSLALSIAEAFDDIGLHVIALAQAHEEANRTDLGTVESHVG